MTQPIKHCPLEQQADVASDRDAFEVAGLDSGWRRFRNELDARLLERFGGAFEESGREQPDPAVLADLALQRALMP